MSALSRKIDNALTNIYIGFKYYKQSRITTHLTSKEKLTLKMLASKVKGKTYVEIGSYLGASAVFISEGIMKHNKSSKLHCIDTWENDAMSEGKRDTYKEFLNNTKLYKNIVIPMRGNSIEVAKQFDKKVDMIFFDGDHTYEGIKADVDAWISKVSPGGLVVFHDIGWAEGVKKVVEEIKPMLKDECRLPNLYWAWVK